MAVVYAAYLEKRSPKAILGYRAWQERYFVLTDTALFYYKNKDDYEKKEPLGELTLAEQILRITASAEDEFCFDILLSDAGRVFELRAASRADCQRWVLILDNARSKLITAAQEAAAELAANAAIAEAAARAAEAQTSRSAAASHEVAGAVKSWKINRDAPAEPALPPAPLLSVVELYQLAFPHISCPYQPRERPNWAADESVATCFLCNDAFSLVQRRHHWCVWWVVSPPYIGVSFNPASSLPSVFLFLFQSRMRECHLP